MLFICLFMLITLKILQREEKCPRLLDYFQSLGKPEWEVMELVKKIHEDRENFSAWLFIKFKLTGVCQRYCTHKKLWCLDNYQNGKRHGLCQSFYDDGKLESEYNFINDIVHGSCKWYYPTGKLQYSSDYIHGKKNCTCQK